MNKTKTSIPYGLICAVFCTLHALHYLVGLFNYFNFLNMLSLICYAYIAATLFMGKRDILPVAGFGALAFTSLLWLFKSGSFFGLILNLIDLASFFTLAFIVVASMTDYLPQFKDTTKTLWFLPGALAGAHFVLFFLQLLFTGIFKYVAPSLPWSIVEIAIIFLAALWAVYVDQLPAAVGSSATSNTASSSASPAAANNYGEGYISMGMHIALLLLTGGIWMYIWVYRVTKYLNCVKDEEYRNPTTKLLLCMFVPFYFIYWTYKSAQRIDKLAQSKGIASDISTLCLILAIFVGIVPPILMQDKMNTICKQSATIPAAAPVAPAAPVVTYSAPAPATADTVTELKRYKELLDMGILTQEEFETKKKQLLNL